MDAQPETPAPAGGDEARIADAYELFWSCVESDAPQDVDTTTADGPPADAYRQFWDLSEA